MKNHMVIVIMIICLHILVVSWIWFSSLKQLPVKVNMRVNPTKKTTWSWSFWRRKPLHVLFLQSMTILEEIELYSCLKYTEVLQIADVFRFHQSLLMGFQINFECIKKVTRVLTLLKYLVTANLDDRWTPKWPSSLIVMQSLPHSPRHQTSRWGPRCAPHRGMPGCGRWAGHVPVEESRISCLTFWIQII